MARRRHDATGSGCTMRGRRRCSNDYRLHLAPGALSDLRSWCCRQRLSRRHAETRCCSSRFNLLQMSCERSSAHDLATCGRSRRRLSSRATSSAGSTCPKSSWMSEFRSSATSRFAGQQPGRPISQRSRRPHRVAVVDCVASASSAPGRALQQRSGFSPIAPAALSHRSFAGANNDRTHRTGRAVARPVVMLKSSSYSSWPEEVCSSSLAVSSRWFVSSRI